MALSESPSIQTPRGYARRTRYYSEIGDGIRPWNEWQPSEYLPVLSVDQYHEIPKVVLAGAIVAWSTLGAVAGDGLTFANGGLVRAITYAARDVYDADDNDTYMVEDANNLTNLVTVAGASATGDTANLPIGFASNDWYSKAYESQALNKKLQDNLAVVCDQLIEIPILTTDQKGTGVAGRALASGCLVVPMRATAGVAVRYVAATDSIEQVIGRCMGVSAITAQGGLERVFTTKGLSLPGSDNDGIESHLDYAAATTKALINITLA